MLTIFYCLYLRKGFLVLAKQQGIIENHGQQAPSASGQFLQQPYIPGQTSEEPDDLKPWVDAHVHMVQAPLSIHMRPRNCHRLVNKRAPRGSYRSPVAPGSGEEANVQRLHLTNFLSKCLLIIAPLRYHRKSTPPPPK